MLHLLYSDDNTTYASGTVLSEMAHNRCSLNVCRLPPELQQQRVRRGSTVRNSWVKSTHVACDCLFKALKTAGKPWQFEMQMKAVKAERSTFYDVFCPFCRCFPLRKYLHYWFLCSQILFARPGVETVNKTNIITPSTKPAVQPSLHCPLNQPLYRILSVCIEYGPTCHPSGLVWVLVIHQGVIQVFLPSLSLTVK